MALDEKNGAKGAIGSIILLIMGVSVATILLIFGSSLSGEVYNTVESDINSIGLTPTSTTFIAVNGTTNNLGQVNISSGTLVIKNGTVTVGLSNFTVDYSAGNVTLTNFAYNGTNLSATYSYYSNTIRYDVQQAIVYGFDSIKTTGQYMPLIILAVVIALVLGLIISFMYFGGNKKGGSGGMAL
jgi:flagellar basal body-associated protein FliL